ncbi:hypothetical protein DL96DRAFT_1710993 [Flagelloscypha sp. PMI_526]|nr:hypothetical protein DL96DRAFT_1710993 [Flagelloscypha sp. PMI_526]
MAFKFLTLVALFSSSALACNPTITGPVSIENNNLEWSANPPQSAQLVLSAPLSLEQGEWTLELLSTDTPTYLVHSAEVPDLVLAILRRSNNLSLTSIDNPQFTWRIDCDTCTDTLASACTIRRAEFEHCATAPAGQGQKEVSLECTGEANQKFDIIAA